MRWEGKCVSGELERDVSHAPCPRIAVGDQVAFE